MTTTTTREGKGSAEPAAETSRESRGDIARVREAIVRGLDSAVTEAGHQGLRYMYDWHAVSNYGRDVTPEPSELVNAQVCLELALDYLRQLRHELEQQAREDGLTEAPF